MKAGPAIKPYPQEIEEALKKLRSVRDRLRKVFPDLSFELDGNLIGDIGEAIAIRDFRFKKLKPCSKHHDFESPRGSKVQVKATQKKKGSVGLGLVKATFEHLIVIQLLDDGYGILFDGPGWAIDVAREHKKSASLSVKRLLELKRNIKRGERLIK